MRINKCLCIRGIFLYLDMDIKKFKPLLGYLKNKYVIAILCFFVWMAFFDPKDFGLTYERTQKLKELKQSENHLIKEIKETKVELALLKSNAESIETYSREHFFMKKDNEEIFIVKKP
jgi:cell division protein DivIC